MMDLKGVLFQLFFRFFDKISALTCGAVKNENITNQSPLDLAKELHKPIIRKFENWKVYSPFIDDIWGADLADMPLISKFNKEFCFLLYVIDIFNKYASIIPLKDSKCVAIANAFQKILEFIDSQTKAIMGK